MGAGHPRHWATSHSLEVGWEHAGVAQARGRCHTGRVQLELIDRPKQLRSSLFLSPVTYPMDDTR